MKWKMNKMNTLKKYTWEQHKETHAKLKAEIEKTSDPEKKKELRKKMYESLNKVTDPMTMKII